METAFERSFYFPRGLMLVTLGFGDSTSKVRGRVSRASTMMNNFESGALCSTNQRSAAGRERKDGYSYPVRFMGRFPAGLATHLRLRHIFALAFGRLTSPRGNDVRQIRSVTRATSCNDTVDHRSCQVQRTVHRNSCRHRPTWRRAAAHSVDSSFPPRRR
jgi:hypothetical protein